MVHIWVQLFLVPPPHWSGFQLDCIKPRCICVILHYGKHAWRTQCISPFYLFILWWAVRYFISSVSHNFPLHLMVNARCGTSTKTYAQVILFPFYFIIIFYFRCRPEYELLSHLQESQHHSSASDLTPPSTSTVVSSLVVQCASWAIWPLLHYQFFMWTCFISKLLERKRLKSSRHILLELISISAWKTEKPSVNLQNIWPGYF